MPVSEDELSAAIETYNRYRSPTATATLLERTADGFRVRFEGPFCRTCCRDDYFEDLRYELKEHGVAIESLAVESVEQTGREAFVVGFSEGGKGRGRG